MVRNYIIIKDWRSKFDEKDILKLLTPLGNLFPDSLSERLDMKSYVRKLVDNAEIYIALNEDDTAGMVCFYANDKVDLKAYISFIAVFPAFQGDGVGKLLLHQAIESAKKAGMSEVFLRVHQDNARAKQFYTTQGFVHDSSEGQKWIMRKSIS